MSLKTIGAGRSLFSALAAPDQGAVGETWLFYCKQKISLLNVVDVDFATHCKRHLGWRTQAAWAKITGCMFADKRPSKFQNEDDLDCDGGVTEAPDNQLNVRIYLFENSKD